MAEDNNQPTRPGKIRVGIVKYLNARPLNYGIERSPIRQQIELIPEYPARVAQMLLNDEIDVGLVPVGILPQLSEWHLVGDYCISTDGEVASVCLFSEVPVEEVTKVYLDYQSRTSVALLKWLMKESWGINPELIAAEDETYREKISGTTAGLVIGDRALEQRSVSTFIYDLGTEWKSLTGLPFVFAAWISKKQMPEWFVEAFNEANGIGLSHIDEIIAAHPFDSYDLKKYFSLHLSYRLDERKRKGMDKFLSVLENA